MRKEPPREHVEASHETFALVRELMEARDREATKQALCQQIRACIYYQTNLKRWLELSYTPEARWHGISFATFDDARKMIDLLEAERKDLAAALMDLLRTPPRKLDKEQEMLLDQYEAHEFAEPPPPGAPDLAEPGTPEKVRLLSERLDARCGLWHDDDPRLEPTLRTAYTPEHADGNFATIGRKFVLALLMTAPEEQP